jgi:hypothetical protein
MPRPVDMVKYWPSQSVFGGADGQGIDLVLSQLREVLRRPAMGANSVHHSLVLLARALGPGTATQRSTTSGPRVHVWA